MEKKRDIGGSIDKRGTGQKFCIQESPVAVDPWDYTAISNPYRGRVESWNACRDHYLAQHGLPRTARPGQQQLEKPPVLVVPEHHLQRSAPETSQPSPLTER